MEFSEDQTIMASGEAVACEFNGGLALLDLRSNHYYSLNQVGAAIWDLIQEPRSLAEICDAVTARYQVDRARCRVDVEALLNSLAKAGLVRLDHGAAV